MGHDIINCSILSDNSTLLHGREATLTDSRIQKLAHILVDHSAAVQPGDRVAIETTTNAEPLVREVYELVLQRGGHPHLLLNLPDQDKLFFKHASDAQLDFTPTFQKLVTDQFEVVPAHPGGRGHPGTEERASRTAVTPAKGHGTGAQHACCAAAAMIPCAGSLTQFPTEAYAKDAGMSFEEYQNFLFSACHADDNTPDPVAHWAEIREQQKKFIARIEGHDKVKLFGPNVDLSLSIKGRKFNNSHGRHNMPDGEIYTGPVEHSVNGWVRFTYPAVYQGRGGGRRGADLRERPRRQRHRRERAGFPADDARLGRRAHATWASLPSAPTSRSTASPATSCSMRSSAAPSTWRSARATPRPAA